MTKAAKIFFLVYILGSVIALIISQFGSVPKESPHGGLVSLPLTISDVGAGHQLQP